MTSRERLLCAMRGGTPDRVPVSPFGLGRIPSDSQLAADLIARTDVIIEVWCGGDPVLGANATVRDETVGDTTTVTIETPAGLLVRRRRRTAVTSATVEFPLKSWEDVDRLLSIPYEPPLPDLRALHEWRDRVGEEGLVMVGLGDAICVPADWFSPADFSLAWADEPDRLERLTAVMSERVNAFVATLCRSGVDAFRIVGGEYASVQLGPSGFSRLVAPFDKALIETIHEHDGIAYYHNHGKVMRYLAALQALGMDALDPLEAPPWGDVDLAKARKVVGDRLCLVGNLDDMEVVDAWEEEAVVRLALERLESAGTSAFVLGGTASGTYGERGARNFLAIAEAVGSRD